MRLFVAIPFSGNVRKQLGEIQQPIEGIHWQNLHQFHLTLRFIGEAGEKMFSKIKDGLAEVRSPVFPLTIKGFGYFPKARSPRVLWAGIETNKLLINLQKSIEKKCQTSGIAGDIRPFKPHITLGKINGAPKRDIMSFVNRHKQFRIEQIITSEFVLYESHLYSDGVAHTPLKRYLLG